MLTREFGSIVACDIECVDSISNLLHPILSMGKLIRQGFDFFLGDKGTDMYATSPGGAYTVKLELGLDDIVRIPHTIRKGRQRERVPITPAAVNTP